MKFWVYSIDWRSMAIEIIAEATTEHAADIEHARHIASLTKSQLMEMAEFKTIAKTAVSPQMSAAVEQFKRLNGRVL